MPRRFLALLALISTLMIIACQGAPAVPALTDPKEILSRSLLSLKDVKTVELTGTFTGAVKAGDQLGTIDLSSVKLNAASDVANKKAKLTLDAPTILGTKIDALVVANALYVKIAGPLAALAKVSADKYTKSDIPQSSSNPLTNAADIAKAVDQLNKGLAALPNPPTKGANEKCGDQDCYHVTVKMTAADLQKLNPDTSGSTAGMSGDLSIDVWSRTNDLRPAKLTLSAVTAQQGTFGATFDFKYDGSITVDAPPADQIAP
jgi:hypothetical protein